jgi:hypothetical protein
LLDVVGQRPERVGVLFLEPLEEWAAEDPLDRTAETLWTEVVRDAYQHAAGQGYVEQPYSRAGGSRSRTWGREVGLRLKRAVVGAVAQGRGTDRRLASERAPPSASSATPATTGWLTATIARTNAAAASRVTTKPPRLIGRAVGASSVIACG